MKLIFKAKVKLESGNQKIQYGRQAAILKVTSLKINRLLPMATINMHMKFEIGIPKQTWLMLRKPCRLQTDGRTDRQTDKVNPVYPPSNFVGRGYKKVRKTFRWLGALVTPPFKCFCPPEGQQGKSEGFDSCDRPSNLAQIWSNSSIFQPVWPWNLMYDLEK